MKKFLKRILLGTGDKKLSILFGAARGIKMNISLDHKSQRYLGLDEREIQSTYKKFSNRSDIFVDIGASDGYYGLVYYKFNPGGTIFLCDADYKFAEQQKNNFLLNDFSLDKVSIVSKYVCDFSDETHVDLDTLLKNEKGSVFIKIDVDGGELEVLKGLKKVLESRKCKLIVETHSKELEDKCIELLQNQGYKTKIIPNAWWRIFIPELRPIEHNRWFSSENHHRN